MTVPDDPLDFFIDEHGSGPSQADLAISPELTSTVAGSVLYFRQKQRQPPPSPPFSPATQAHGRRLARVIMDSYSVPTPPQPTRGRTLTPARDPKTAPSPARPHSTRSGRGHATRAHPLGGLQHMQRGRRYLYDPLDDELTVGASLSSSDSDLGPPVYNSTAIADSEDPSDLSGSDDVDDQNGTDASDKVTGPRVVTGCTSIACPVDTSDDEKWIVEDFVRNLIEGGEQDFKDSSDADSDATDMDLDARLAKMGGKLRDRLVPLSDFNDLLDDYGDMSLSDLDEDMEVLPTLTRRQRRRLMNREASRGKVRTAASEPLKPPPVDSADSGEQRRRLTKAEVGMLTSHFSAKSRFARAKREMGLPMAPDRKGKMAPSSQQRNTPPTSRLERKEHRKLLRRQQKDKSKRQPKPPGPPVQGGSGRRKTPALSDTSPTVFVAASSTLAADLTATSAPAITTMTAMRREDMAFGHVRAIGSTNPGHRLLAKMGWQPGQGIGISRQGITDPIQVQIRKTRRGLGHGENPVHDNDLEAVTMCRRRHAV